jgi:hypothetical protein
MAKLVRGSHSAETARTQRTEMPASHLVAHAADRWARAVVGILECPFDPKTITMWGKSIGVSEGALRDWCKVARCRPKSSLDFARLLRAIVQSEEYGWDPFNLLDVANERTMRNLLKRGGLSDLLSTNAPVTLRGFLLKQRFVTNDVALNALAQSLELRTTELGSVRAGGRPSRKDS